MNKSGLEKWRLPFNDQRAYISNSFVRNL